MKTTHLLNCINVAFDYSKRCNISLFVLCLIKIGLTKIQKHNKKFIKSTTPLKFLFVIKKHKTTELFYVIVIIVTV
jgi:hypothetical protein